MQASWLYIVISTSVLLAIYCLWIEIRRGNKNWLWLRMIAVLTACAALACIALPIHYKGDTVLEQGHKIILLTSGFNKDALKDKNAEVYTFDQTVKTNYPKARLITINDALNKNGQINIYGYGLNPLELQEFHGKPIKFYPAKIPAGVTHISFNSKLKAGEGLLIQGSYNNPSAKKIKLTLKGLNTRLDSVMAAPGLQTFFEFKTTPKAIGRLVYTLLADTDLEGEIPVQIARVKPVRVLVLSASPGFETRFLKNWLGSNGYAIAVRSSISKNKYNIEYINTASLKLDRLSASVLNNFDVVIGDLSVLNTLSQAEGAALYQQNTDNGLGIIISGDSTGRSSWLNRGFPVVRSSGKETGAFALVINGKKSTSDKLNAGTDYITYRDGTQPLVINAQKRILTSSSLSGSGKLLFTTLGNTYSWMLAGDQDDYAVYWSALITKAARKGIISPDVKPVHLPFKNEQVQLRITDNKFPSVSINGEMVAPSQNLNTPFEWDVFYWPAETGWQFVKQDDTINWWYCHSKSEWLAVQASSKYDATKKYEKDNAKQDIVTKQIHQNVQNKINKIYFYILLLAACTFLWIEAKLSY